MTFKESKSSMPSLERFSLKNSVSFCACNARLSSRYTRRCNKLKNYNSIQWHIKLAEKQNHILIVALFSWLMLHLVSCLVYQ